VGFIIAGNIVATDSSSVRCLYTHAVDVFLTYLAVFGPEFTRHPSPTIPSDDLLLVVISVIMTRHSVYVAGIIKLIQKAMNWAIAVKHCCDQLIDIVKRKRQDSKGGNSCIL
jgi:hypothetical protein